MIRPFLHLEDVCEDVPMIGGALLGLLCSGYLHLFGNPSDLSVAHPIIINTRRSDYTWVYRPLSTQRRTPCELVMNGG